MLRAMGGPQEVLEPEEFPDERDMGLARVMYGVEGSRPISIP